MINLKNDYCGIAHPKVLEKLLALQNDCFNSYGLDTISDKAKELIKKELHNDSVDIHFMVGGTITNKTVIAHALRPYEAVIAVDTGHINVHETGAIEETGHKVVTVPNINGKITTENIKKAFYLHTDEHMVKPKMVYISNSTEIGSVYTYNELKEIKETCDELGLYLFIDGARLGAALTSKDSDLRLSDLPKLCDVFYIGGTKNGLMLGEAVVIVNDKLKDDFRYSIKHYGGMYSKGFVAGINFFALFENGLFLDIAKTENELAYKLYDKLIQLGVKFDVVPSTNQIFPIFKTKHVEQLEKEIMFEVWSVGEEETTIRFVTSYMTTNEDVEKTIEVIRKIIK